MMIVIIALNSTAPRTMIITILMTLLHRGRELNGGVPGDLGSAWE